jgi:hypothetical protein
VRPTVALVIRQREGGIAAGMAVNLNGQIFGRVLNAAGGLILLFSICDK